MNEVSLKGHLLTFLIFSDESVFTPNKTEIVKYSEEQLKPFLEALGLSRKVTELEETELSALAEQLECSQILSAHPQIDASTTNVEELLEKWKADNSAPEAPVEVSAQVIAEATSVVEAIAEAAQEGASSEELQVIVHEASDEAREQLTQWLTGINQQNQELVALVQEQTALNAKTLKVLANVVSIQSGMINFMTKTQASSALPQEVEA